MKKTWFIILIFISISGCKKNQDLGHLQDYFTLRNKGADMPVWVEGNLNSNALVLVVHGGPGGDGQIYNTYSKGFSDKMESAFAMVYWDQRGSGNSSGHFKTDAYTVEAYVDDLEQLIRVLKLKYGQQRNIFLLGHSWGGTLITAFALDAARQSQISGFIEVDGAHDFKNVDVILERFKEIGLLQITLGQHAPEWEGIINFCNTVDANNATDAQITQLNQYGFAAEQYLLDFGSIVNLTGKVDAAKYSTTGTLSYPWSFWNSRITGSQMFPVLKNADFTSEMVKIKIPSLFLWGRFDMVVPRQSGIKGFNSCGSLDKQYVEFTRSGHSPMLNQMEDFTNVVIPWIVTRIK